MRVHGPSLLDSAEQALDTIEASSSRELPSYKRPRNDSFSDESSGEIPGLAVDAGRGYKRLRQCIQRPGVPSQCNLASCRFPDKLSPPPRDDDKDGHYQFELGENLSSRYKILSKMGEGTFGRVLECWDRKRKDYVAIKIVRNIDKYRHAAMIELEVLNTLERNDPEGLNHCVTLREWFDYRGHVCMVFERLGLSLFDFMRKNNYRPFTLTIVQSFCQQLLEAVAYMHELRLVHTDLKPENILLVEQGPGVAGGLGGISGSANGSSCDNSSCAVQAPLGVGINMSGISGPRVVVNVNAGTAASGFGCSGRMPGSSEIKVIDFGSATFEEQYHSCIVSTRHYRAPEVILGLGWSYPCDMWSVGCILIELITGEALFQTHENLEHLAMMEAVLGPMPGTMAVKCAHTQSCKYFQAPTGRLNWPDGAANRKSVKAVKRLMGLRQLIVEHGDPSARGHEDELVDLIHRLLRYEPDERLTAQQALAHPFLRKKLPLQPGMSSQPQFPSRALSTSVPVQTMLASFPADKSGPRTLQMTTTPTVPATEA